MNVIPNVTPIDSRFVLSNIGLACSTGDIGIPYSQNFRIVIELSVSHLESVSLLSRAREIQSRQHGGLQHHLSNCQCGRELDSVSCNLCSIPNLPISPSHLPAPQIRQLKTGSTAPSSPPTSPPRLNPFREPRPPLFATSPYYLPRPPGRLRQIHRPPQRRLLHGTEPVLRPHAPWPRLHRL